MSQPSNSDFTVRFGRLPGEASSSASPPRGCAASRPPPSFSSLPCSVPGHPAPWSLSLSGSGSSCSARCAGAGDPSWRPCQPRHTSPSGSLGQNQLPRPSREAEARRARWRCPGMPPAFASSAASGMAAIVHDPHDQTLTAVGLVRHPAYVLLSPEEQERRIHCWGRTLAALANTGTGVRLQILEVTLPDAGRGITGWWDTHRVPDEGWAVQQYEELMRQCAPSSSSHKTLVAVSLDLRKIRGHVRQSGRGIAAGASALQREMSSIEAGLRAADLTLAGWLDDTTLAATLLAAYDPAADDTEATDLTTAGPMAVEEHWDHLRHDSGHSSRALDP